jgi:hypothetical protein
MQSVGPKRCKGCYQYLVQCRDLSMSISIVLTSEVLYWRAVSRILNSRSSIFCRRMMSIPIRFTIAYGWIKEDRGKWTKTYLILWTVQEPLCCNIRQIPRVCIYEWIKVYTFVVDEVWQFLPRAFQDLSVQCRLTICQRISLSHTYTWAKPTLPQIDNNIATATWNESWMWQLSGPTWYPLQARECYYIAGQMLRDLARQQRASARRVSAAIGNWTF